MHPDAPAFDPAAPLQFVVNAKAGSADADATCEAIEAACRSAGRRGALLFAGPGELAHVAQTGAEAARRERSAVVAVGGDGTINTVAQAAYRAGGVMGVLAGGTFNYVAREHGVPEPLTDALPWLLAATPAPVQVAGINDHLFLVNASLGLYPDLLQDRERWKARFGRSRMVAFGAGMSTLLGAQQQLTLTLEVEGRRHEVRALTVVVANSRLQLEQLGLASDDTVPADGEGMITAVILKPVGTFAMLTLMVRGALGSLGDADGVERIACRELVVRPSREWGRQRMKVAFDGEVAWMQAPLTIRVMERPLWVLKGDVIAKSA